MFSFVADLIQSGFACRVEKNLQFYPRIIDPDFLKWSNFQKFYAEKPYFTLPIPTPSPSLKEGVWNEAVFKVMIFMILHTKKKLFR